MADKGGGSWLSFDWIGKLLPTEGVNYSMKKAADEAPLLVYFSNMALLLVAISAMVICVKIIARYSAMKTPHGAKFIEKSELLSKNIKSIVDAAPKKPKAQAKAMNRRNA